MGQSVHQGFSVSLFAQESFRPILGNLLKGAKRLLSRVFSPRSLFALFAAGFMVYRHNLPTVLSTLSDKQQRSKTRRRDLRNTAVILDTPRLKANCTKSHNVFLLLVPPGCFCCYSVECESGQWQSPATPSHSRSPSPPPSN